MRKGNKFLAQEDHKITPVQVEAIPDEMMEPGLRSHLINNLGPGYSERPDIFKIPHDQSSNNEDSIHVDIVRKQ